ncbi:hypothetical protein V5O48_004066 [Marasmius crinis-equi]|uniref:F-box domain-containing protein n=1 Tax=Marasmius crinis-equi TaxID=585013 RepID=A0ABR3FR43_9AGAR
MVDLAEQDRIFLKAAHQTSRITRLDLFSESLDIANLFNAAWSKMNTAAPLLRTIRIHCLPGIEGSVFTELPDTFLAGNAPRLTKLILSGCSISWKSPLLENLTILTVRYPPVKSKPTVQTVFGALQSLSSSLIALELRHCVTPVSPFHLPSHTGLVFCRLRRMVLSVESLPCLSLLRSMSFPDTTAIHLVCYHPPQNFPVQQLFAYVSHFLAPGTIGSNHPRVVRGLALIEKYGLSILARNTDNSDLRPEVSDVSEDFPDGKLPHLQLDIRVQHLSRDDTIRSLLGLVPLSHLENLRIGCASPFPPISLSHALEKSGFLKSVYLQDHVSHNSLELVLWRTALYPSLERLTFVGVNFQIDSQSNLLLALVEGLKRRARDGCPLKRVELTECTGLDAIQLDEIRSGIMQGGVITSLNC